MKQLSLLLLLSIIIILPQKSEALFDYLYLADKDSQYLNELKLNSKNLLNSIILVPAESFDEFEAADMIKRVDKLPKSLLEKLVRENIKVKLFTGKLTELSTAKNLAGITPRGYANANTTWDEVPGAGGGQIVLVKIGASEQGAGHGSVNLELHELAHSIDTLVFNRIRDDSYFQTIWRSEVNVLFGSEPYFQLFPEEYFAETFAMFYANIETNKQLSEKAPKTYQYISNLK